MEWTGIVQYMDAAASWLPHRNLGSNSSRTYWGIDGDLLCGLQYAQFSNMFHMYSSEIFGVIILFLKFLYQFFVSLFSNCHYRILWSDLFFAVKLNWEYFRPVDSFWLEEVSRGWLRVRGESWRLPDAVFFQFLITKASKGILRQDNFKRWIHIWGTYDRYRYVNINRLVYYSTYLILN